MKDLLRALVALPLAACVPAPDVDTTSNELGSDDLTGQIANGDTAIHNILAPYQPLLDPVMEPLPLPDAPIATLIGATTALSARLGVPQDPTEAITSARLPPALAGRLANAVAALDRCTAITQTAIDGQDLAQLATGTVDASRFSAVPNCASELLQAARDLQAELAANTISASDDPGMLPRDPGPIEDPICCVEPVGTALRVWPVFSLDRGTTGNLYANDYLLIADAGGNDRYYNNAGSNVVDINWAPATTGVTTPGAVGLRGVGPAKGCQRAVKGLQDRDCILAAAVVVDLGGDDTYGQWQLPDPAVDGQCTPSTTNLVRRMVTNGVGLAGVGLLIDGGGSDHYNSKTVSNGAGH
nr:hypothetical protein [Deltaproteobacteria bacterium]